MKHYVESHEKLLHLIVVRNDLAAFQHVHPVLGGEGTWRVSLNLSRAGDYRVFADFTPADGPALTLGANLHVAGPYNPQPLPPPVATAEVDDYTVALRGTPKANEPSMLTLSVRRDGNAVGDLQPYLGAYGHLVAVRASDLAYLHVHPNGEPGDGDSLGSRHRVPHDVPKRRRLPAVPRLPAPRRGAHRRIHRDGRRAGQTRPAPPPAAGTALTCR